MELKKRILKIKFEGNDYEMKFPTVKKQMDFSKKHDAIKDPFKQLDHLMSFLEKQGLPKDVCEELEVPHLNQIVEAFGGAEKK